MSTSDSYVKYPVAIYRIFEVPRLGTKLMQTSMPLTYTPRKFVTHPVNQYFYMIEADHRVMGEDAAKSKIAELVGVIEKLWTTQNNDL